MRRPVAQRLGRTARAAPQTLRGMADGKGDSLGLSGRLRAAAVTIAADNDRSHSIPANMSNVSSTPATPPGSSQDTPCSELRLQHYKARRDQLLRERRTQRAADAAYMEEYEGLVEELRTAEQKLMELAGRHGRPPINPAYLARAEAEAIQHEARRQGREGAGAPNPPPEDPVAQQDETGRWVARSAAHLAATTRDLDQGAGPSSRHQGTVRGDQGGTNEAARAAGPGTRPAAEAKEEATPPTPGGAAPQPADDAEGTTGPVSYTHLTLPTNREV